MPKPKAKARGKAATGRRGPPGRRGLHTRLYDLLEASLIKGIVAATTLVAQAACWYTLVFGPGLVGGYGLTLAPPNFWFMDLDFDNFEVDVGAIYMTELGTVLAFLMWVRWLNVRDELRPEPAVRGGVGLDEVGLALSWGAAVVALWGPRGSAVLFGVITLGSLRRARIHFSASVCAGASGALFACMLRLGWTGEISLLLRNISIRLKNDVFFILGILLGTKIFHF